MQHDENVWKLTRKTGYQSNVATPRKCLIVSCRESSSFRYRQELSVRLEPPEHLVKCRRLSLFDM